MLIAGSIGTFNTYTVSLGKDNCVMYHPERMKRLEYSLLHRNVEN